MSYNRTVSCGYCGISGHNKRSCPDLTKLVQEWEKSDDPYYKERAQRLKSVRKGRAKRCSHCNETGHTIRTCDQHKALVNSTAQDWLDARHLVKDRMNEHNFGVGSLVRIKKTQWCNSTAEFDVVVNLAIVVDIEHNTITNRVLTDNTYFRRITPVAYNYVTGEYVGKRVFGRLPFCIVDKGYQKEDYYGKNEYEKHKDDYILVSSSEATIPSDFLEWDKICKGAYEHARGRK